MTEPSKKTNIRVLFALTLIHFTGDFYNSFVTPCCLSLRIGSPSP